MILALCYYALPISFLSIDEKKKILIFKKLHSIQMKILKFELN